MEQQQYKEVLGDKWIESGKVFTAVNGDLMRDMGTFLRGTWGRFSCPAFSGTGETSPCPSEKRPHVPPFLFHCKGVPQLFGSKNSHEEEYQKEEHKACNA